jgi:hypothetical protein
LSPDCVKARERGADRVLDAYNFCGYPHSEGAVRRQFRCGLLGYQTKID